MKTCKKCRYKGCALCGTDHVIHAADCENYTSASNADRIRSMTDEELANEFAKIEGDPYNGATIGFWLDWLRDEAKDGEQD